MSAIYSILLISIIVGSLLQFGIVDILIPTKFGRVTNTSQPYYRLNNIWSKDATDRLLDFVKSAEFRNAAQDATSTVDHIGEKYMLKDGETKCPHKYLIPTKNGSYCTLAQRFDIALHFLRSGGRTGLRETYDSLVARMLPFSAFFFDKFDDPDLKLLFKSPHYVENSIKACGGKSVFDPIQLGIILNLPGQVVSMHYDVPWFVGATRFTQPQWLLICMEQSKLFEDLRVPQIQGVAYIHKWTTELGTPDSKEGSFHFYPNGEDGDVDLVPPNYNTGIIVDGSRVVHGTDPVMPHLKPNPLSKDDQNIVTFNKDTQRWELFVNDEKKKDFPEDEVRLSLVWRARCFATEEDKLEYRKNDKENQLSTESILNKLADNLVQQGKMEYVQQEGTIFEKSGLGPIELAEKLINNFVRMPFPEKKFKFNYCMGEKVGPEWMKPFFKLICN